MKLPLKKICIAIPCLNLGGTEIAALAMTNALVRDKKYSVMLVCYYEYDLSMIQRFEAIGIDIKLLKLKRGGIKSLFELFAALKKLFIEQKPDVVHVQYIAPGMIPILAAKAAGIRKVFATIHISGSSGYGLKARLMFKVSAFMTDHFFCVSNDVEKFWFGGKTLFNTNHSVILNCINKELFQAEIEKISIEGIESDNTVIGIVGRVAHQKGHDILLKSMARLIKNHPCLKLLVIGDGPDIETVQFLSGELGLEDHVIWYGRLEPEKLPQAYKAMDIFAMPSRFEGFGLTAIEAMASGVPVIASRIDGLKEVIGIDGENGLLCNSEDGEDLAVKIEMLMSDVALQKKIVSNAEKRVHQLFSVQQHDQKWQTAYTTFMK